MIVNGIDIGCVTGASGVTNFGSKPENSDWWWHRWIPKPFGPDFTGVTRVTKTTTLKPRPGNMPLDEHDQPTELHPACIRMHWQGKHVVNSVGLAGRGAKALFEDGGWQKQLKNGEPLIISFMSLKDDRIEMLEELDAFLYLLRIHIPEQYWPQIVLQQNFSCPNAGLDVAKYDDLVYKVQDAGRRVADATRNMCGYMPKFSVTTPPWIAVKAANTVFVHAVAITNTVGWRTDIEWLRPGFNSLQIPWKLLEALFGCEEGQSPLADVGLVGGYSGVYLLPILTQWIKLFREQDTVTPLNVGGGAYDWPSYKQLIDATGWNSSIAIGSVAFLRPWRVADIIRRAECVYKGRSIRLRDALSFSTRDTIRHVANNNHPLNTFWRS